MRIALVAAALLVPTAAPAQRQQNPDAVLRTMRTELARSLATLQRQPTPPYFLSYEIVEVRSAHVTASFGAVVESSDERRRHVDVEVRVGDYTFDNTHSRLRDGPDFASFFDDFGSELPVPLDDDPAVLAALLWHQTDSRYQRAVDRLAGARTSAEVTVSPEDSSPDFSREPPERHREPLATLRLDRRAWEDRLRRLTAPFARESLIYAATAAVDASVEHRWYVNSEGSEIQTSQPRYHVRVSAFTKADDGMELPRYETYFATDPAGLPPDSTIAAGVRRIIADLHALRRAPVIDPYTGPAILSGRASAVFFHEVLGHRVEGHRQRNENEGQTFRRKVDEVILPADMSVVFDPTVRTQGPVELAGAYRFDDEGVRARRVNIVEHGLLQEFLMSRSPIEGFARSNGHGRRQPGHSPVARQSNLIVTAAQPRSRTALRELLLEQVRRDRKPFGLLFEDIEGGFTMTGRVIPNAFNVVPVMVYRLFADGREELVRGVDFIGTPLITLSRIIAADDQVEVFNGMCGAESGWIPVAAVSPGVLVSQVEIQKKEKAQDRPPLLAPPPGTADRP
jgi:predicted Zn-dependent protease